jgi:hypothetical protein
MYCTVAQFFATITASKSEVNEHNCSLEKLEAAFFEKGGCNGFTSVLSEAT